MDQLAMQFNRAPKEPDTMTGVGALLARMADYVFLRNRADS